MAFMSDRQKLERIINAPLLCHRAETEITRKFDPAETLLPRSIAEELNTGCMVCYAISPEVLEFIASSVDECTRSLEVGAGKSTLVFALSKADHISITPAANEVAEIKHFAQQEAMPIDSVLFITEPSEHFLPRCEIKELDLVLIDGKHAFPWPILDWFFTADRLQKGGIMLLD